MKQALITGITGQDGSYLTEWLLQQGYCVHGLVRRTSGHNTARIDHLLADPVVQDRVHLHHADLTDGMTLTRLVSELRPHEVYNLAAQSHVAVSFEEPVYTADCDALGTLRLLEAIRQAGLQDACRFYQASTSEMFGLVAASPQTEDTPFHPRSPYGVAKLYAHWMAVNYREAYGMFACSGLLFNHESPRRGETFVTRKITLGLSRVLQGRQACLELGNLDARRDWGHARDYVRAQWLMLQQNEPRDYVIATGVQHSVRAFCDQAAAAVGVRLDWRGEGVDEQALLAASDNPAVRLEPGAVVIRVAPALYRPAEVDNLLGDASRAAAELNWRPEVGFDELVQEMMDQDFNA